MKINKDRLKENILKVGEIGKIEGQGITREAFSKDYKEASEILVKSMEDAGLEVQVDGIWNVFGKKKGTDSDLPSIMVGSHLDTVRNGGLFDGNLGIIAALECMHILNENSIKTRHPIEIVGFNAEEGSEMGGTFGSRIMIGYQDPKEKGLGDKLGKYGITVEDAKKSVRDVKGIKAFLELHIEQGGNLYSKGVPIGIVEGIAGITRYKVSAIGEANHAGTTTMALRKDAMTGAAKLIVEIERIAKNIGEPMVATVGTIKAFPGSVSVIPERVEFVLELRDLEQDKIEQAVLRIKEATKEIKDIQFEFELLISKSPVMTNKNIVETIEKCCLNKGMPYEVMASGAGHDAKEIGRKVPAGMIFVPSRDGKSHCKEEWTDWEDVYRGTEILLDTILALDKDQ